ncbi:hypothetical protein C5Q97_15445 [Victivallales bacterium CCUG 44730]|nr:hypothetical protein C5Q97_15445 [Victivallales bacterium CCUG 44730]
MRENEQELRFSEIYAGGGLHSFEGMLYLKKRIPSRNEEGEIAFGAVSCESPANAFPGSK